MSTPPNRYLRRNFPLAACLLLLPLLNPYCAFAVSGDSAPADAPKNLARLNCGARLDVESSPIATRAGSSGAGANTHTLLLDDQTLDYQLHSGNTSFVITLPKICLVDRFTFINEQAHLSGSVDVSVSNIRLTPNDYRWQSAGREVKLAGERFVNVPLTGMEAKYVRVSFHVQREGTLAGIGLYGRKTLQAFSEQRRRVSDGTLNVGYVLPSTRAYDGLHYNFANLYAKARVAYVSTGSLALAQRTIDDDPATGFEFSPTDAHPTIVVELAEGQRLRRVSAVYEMQPGQLDIYLLNNVPDSALAGNLDELKPVLSLTDADATGKAAADFDPRGARYVALRWTPIGRRAKKGGFIMCEIGAFSDNSPSLFGWVDLPERLAIASGINVLPPSPPIIVPASP